MQFIYSITRDNVSVKVKVLINARIYIFKGIIIKDAFLPSRKGPS